ncbi:MAG: PfkB family carbohydrate kinase [Planctomycetota bacterium]|jgi:ribokinase
MGAPFTYDVFGLGQCVVDRIGLVAAFAGADEKCEYADALEQCGGPVATALVALSLWGRRCAFAGVVGDDPEGARIRADLEAEGVDTSRLLVRPDSRSQHAFVAVERGTGRRTIYWQRPTGAPPAPEEIAPAAARLFLTDGLFASASVDLARRAERVVVDAGTLREGTRALLPLAQVFVASESFARALVGADDPRGACRRMREEGVEVAGVTLGARGYVASFGDTWLERPAHRVEAVDTTGCGDVFHAGLVEGLLARWPLARCFDFAAWAAAGAATHLGNRAGIPARDGYPGVVS